MVAPTSDEFDNEFDDFDHETLDSLMQGAETLLSATQQARSEPAAQQPVAASKPNGVAHPPCTAATKSNATREPLTKRPRLNGESDVSNGRAQTAAPERNPGKPLLVRRRRITQQVPQDDEQMPEISVGQDGSYAVGSIAVSTSGGVKQPATGRQAQATRDPSPRKQQDQAVVHQNPGHAYRPGMPQLDNFEGDQDALWQDAAALDQLEEEAITKSQQIKKQAQLPQALPTRHAHASTLAPPRGFLKRASSPTAQAENGHLQTSSSQSGPLPAAGDQLPPSQNGTSASRRQIDLNREAAYKRRIEVLQRQMEQAKQRAESVEKAQESTTKDTTHRELGELSILRGKVKKFEAENALLRKEMMQKEEMHKQEIAEEKKQHEESLQQVKTVEAFSVSL